MVVVSILSHSEFEPDDHRDDTPNFNAMEIRLRIHISIIFLLSTIEMNDLIKIHVLEPVHSKWVFNKGAIYRNLLLKNHRNFLEIQLTSIWKLARWETSNWMKMIVWLIQNSNPNHQIELASSGWFTVELHFRFDISSSGSMVALYYDNKYTCQSKLVLYFSYE